jgi:hypothetical protein
MPLYSQSMGEDHAHSHAQGLTISEPVRSVNPHRALMRLIASTLGLLYVGYQTFWTASNEATYPLSLALFQVSQTVNVGWTGESVDYSLLVADPRLRVSSEDPGNSLTGSTIVVFCSCLNPGCGASFCVQIRGTLFWKAPLAAPLLNISTRWLEFVFIFTTSVRYLKEEIYVKDHSRCG